MNKQKKALCGKKESGIGTRKQETKAEKEEVTGNKSKPGDKAAARNLTKDWEKLMAAKATARIIAARVRGTYKKQSPWGEPTAQVMTTTFQKKYPDALLRKGLTSFSPAEAKRYLLFVEPRKVGSRSILPNDSISISSSQGYRQWELPGEQESDWHNRLIGVLKASEARSRVRALRLRYARMRAEEIKHLISRQKTARAAIRLEIFLPPLLNPTKIPDCLDRRERHRVEAILKEDNNYTLFR